MVEPNTSHEPGKREKVTKEDMRSNTTLCVTRTVVPACIVCACRLCVDSQKDVSVIRVSLNLKRDVDEVAECLILRGELRRRHNLHKVADKVPLYTQTQK